MQNSFNSDWCRLNFHLLVYLDEVWDTIVAHDGLIARDAGWGKVIDVDEQGTPEVSIGFEVRKNIPKIKGNHLWVGFWQTGEELKNGRPIWIQIMKDENDWQRLQDLFPEGLKQEDEWGIGLEWPLPLNANATLDEVKKEGANLGKRIIDVLTISAE